VSTFPQRSADYETLGIPEYWIVDYLGLGATRYIGKPKQPTISVYQLVEGEYQIRQFRGVEQVISAMVPDLALTTAQMFQA
jgi:Uma2 family endonuclease